MKLEFYGKGYRTATRRVFLKYTDGNGLAWEFTPTASFATGIVAALEQGLRALNDAPLPRKRIWVNFYPLGSATHPTKEAAIAAASPYAHILRVAVPFDEVTED